MMSVDGASDRPGPAFLGVVHLNLAGALRSRTSLLVPFLRLWLIWRGLWLFNPRKEQLSVLILFFPQFDKRKGDFNTQENKVKVFREKRASVESL